MPDLAQTAAKMGANPKHVSMAQMALGWSTLFSVFLQLLPILSNSIPTVFQIIDDLIAAIKSGTFTWQAFTDLVAKDEPAVIAIVQQIAAALGIAIPLPGPVVP